MADSPRSAMVNSPSRRFEDPESSTDPRIRALLDQLSALPAPSPDPTFRADLRIQLVALAPRLIAESATTQSAVEPAPDHTNVATLTELPRTVDTVDSGIAILTPDGQRATEEMTPQRGGRPTPGGRTSVATSSDATRAQSGTHADRTGVLAQLPRVRLGRPLLIAASVIAVLAVVLGGAVGLSRRALPGDALYGLKRTSEGWQLAIDGNDTDTARDLLHFATTRSAEVQALLRRSSTTALGDITPGHASAAGALNAHTATLITQTLAAGDDEVARATRLLSAAAMRAQSAAPLQILTAWAPSQIARLRAIARALPVGALRVRAMRSDALVAAAAQRLSALRPLVRCNCPGRMKTDRLGVVPCTGCTGSSAPGSPSGSTGSHGGTGSSTGTGGPGAPGSPGAPGASGSGSGALTSTRGAGGVVQPGGSGSSAPGISGSTSAARSAATGSRSGGRPTSSATAPPAPTSGSGLPTISGPTTVPTSRVPVRRPTSKIPPSTLPTSRIPITRIPPSRIPVSKMPTSRIPTSRIPASRIPASTLTSTDEPEPAPPTNGSCTRSVGQGQGAHCKRGH